MALIHLIIIILFSAIALGPHMAFNINEVILLLLLLLLLRIQSLEYPNHLGYDSQNRWLTTDHAVIHAGTPITITFMGLKETFPQPRNRRIPPATLSTSSLPSTTVKEKNTRASIWEMYKPMLSLYSWDLPRVPSSFRSVSRCLLNRWILRTNQLATRRESLRGVLRYHPFLHDRETYPCLEGKMERIKMKT